MLFQRIKHTAKIKDFSTTWRKGPLAFPFISVAIAWLAARDACDLKLAIFSHGHSQF